MSVINQRLYKYRNYSAKSLEIFIKREVYFANPQSLNDPFDCRIDIVDSLNQVTKAVKPQHNAGASSLINLRNNSQFLGEIQSDLTGLGIFSLSKDPMNVLMWSHYAANHSGFCIGFKLSEKFTEFNATEEIIGCVPVRYTKNNPFVDYFRKIAKTKSRPELVWQTLHTDGMTSKAQAWSYEQEVRVLRKKPGPVSFFSNELVEVIFGLSMPKESRETIQKLLSAPEWHHVHIKEVYRINGFKLGIRFVI